MKIFYIITKSELGGAQTHVRDLMQGMRARGHEVALMCAPGGWLVDQAHDLGVTYFANNYFSNNLNPLNALRAINAVSRAVNDYKPGLVSCHSSGGGFYGRMGVHGRVPTIFTAHSWAFTDGMATIQRIIAIVAETIAGLFTEKAICVSEYDRQLARRYGVLPARKLITIHNGVQPLPSNDSLSGNPAADHEPQSDQIRIISVGRLAYPKRYDVLIDAYASLDPAIRERTTVTIVGDGPDRDALVGRAQRRGVSDAIVFAGAQSHDAVTQLLAGADLFILLSRHEGFPMTILEAMNAELPVIASAVGGIPEAVDARTGILVSNDMQSVAAALATLIQQPEQRAMMGKQGKQKLLAQFSLERFLDATEGVYRSVLRKQF